MGSSSLATPSSLVVFAKMMVLVVLSSSPSLLPTVSAYTQTQYLVQPRSDITATTMTTAGSTAVFMGGCCAPGTASAVDIFDGLNRVWTSTYLSGRVAAAGTAVGNIALFGGGITNGAVPVATVDMYDVSRDYWTPMDQYLSEPRSQLSARSVGSYSLFAGGKLANGQATTVVDIYDHVVQAWSRAGGGNPGGSGSGTGSGPNGTIINVAGGLSTARYNMASTNVGSMVFFAGGTAGTAAQSVDIVDRYDASTRIWRVDHLGQASDDLVAASVSIGTVHRKALFAGHGLASDRTACGAAVPPNCVATMNMYDAVIDQWSVTTWPADPTDVFLAASACVTCKADKCDNTVHYDTTSKVFFAYRRGRTFPSSLRSSCVLCDDKRWWCAQRWIRFRF